MKFTDLLEAKITSRDIINELSNYIDDNYYISLTSVDKLGINPKSGFNTPIGIYAYPINTKIHDNLDAAGSFNLGLPYAGDTNYIWLFSPKNSENGLYLGSSYTGDDYAEDILKLEMYIIEDLGLSETVYEVIKSYTEKTSRGNSVSWYIWNFTRKLSDYLTEKKLLKDELYDSRGNPLDLGLPVIPIDSGRAGIVTEIDRINGLTVSFPHSTPDYIMVSEHYDFNEVYVIDNKIYNTYVNFVKNKKFSRGDKVNYKDSDEYVIFEIKFFNNEITLYRNKDEDFVDLRFSEFFKYNPDLEFDVYGSNLKENSNDDDNKIKHSAQVMWSHILFRVLGYDFVVDSEGKGIIHGNEPMQAVFFNRSVIKVESQYINPDRNNNEEDPFYDASSQKELNKYPKEVINRWLNFYANNPNKFPSDLDFKFEVDSQKLQAKLIYKSPKWYKYISNVKPEVINKVNKKILNDISNLNDESSVLKRIFSYINEVHFGEWPEGELALIKKFMSKPKFYGNILYYVDYVNNRNRWPIAEKEILKTENYNLMLYYANMVIGGRWPEMEKRLIELHDKYLNSDKNELMLIVDAMQKYQARYGSRETEIFDEQLK